MQIWKSTAGPESPTCAAFARVGVVGSSAIAVGALVLLFTATAPRVQAQAQSSASPVSKIDSKDVPVPVYKVDPFWPKPLPHHWILQGIPVMVADKDDHIWVVSRPRDANPDETGAASNPPRTDCCVPAPAVLEFDTAGNLLKAWGAPGYVPGWPAEGIARPGDHCRRPARQRLARRKRPLRRHSEIHWRRKVPVGFWPPPSQGTGGTKHGPCAYE